MAEAGWYKDPYERYLSRWFDGDQWTAYVQIGEATGVDPLGAGYAPATTSPNVPLMENTQARPSASSSSPEVGSARQVSPDDEKVQRSSSFAKPVARASERADSWTKALRPFLDSLGPDAKQRPQPSLADSIAAGGGAIAFASVPLFLTGEGFSSSALAVIAALVIAGAWFIMVRVSENLSYLRHAAVAASVVAVPTLAIALFVRPGSAGFRSESLTGVFVLAAAGYLAGWALPGFKGRPTFLAAGLTFLVCGVSSAFAPSRRSYETAFVESLFGYRNPASNFLRNLRDDLAFQSGLLLIMSIMLLLVALQLDRSHYFGAATGFVAAGLLTSGIGIVLVGASNVSLISILLLVAIGILACLVGTVGQRRATTWIGAFFVVGGLVGAVLALLKPDSPTAIGLAGLISSAVLIAGPTYALKSLKSRRAA